VKAAQGSQLVTRTALHLSIATSGTRCCHCPQLSWAATAPGDHPRLTQMHCSELSHQPHPAWRTGWTTDVLAPSISLKTQRQPLEGARRKVPKSRTEKKLIKTRSAKGEFQADSLILIYMKLPAESCWKLDNSTCLVRMRETLGFIFNITKSFLFQPSEGSTWMLHQDNLWRLFQPPCEQRDSHCLLKLAGTHVHAQMWCQLGHSCRRNKAARNHVPAADLAENMSCLLLFLHRVGSEQRHTWKLPSEHWAFCCKVKHAGSECTAEWGFWRWLSDGLNCPRVRRKHRRLRSEVKPSLSPLEVHRNTKDPIPMSTPNFYSRWNRFSKPGVKGSKETLL